MPQIAKGKAGPIKTQTDVTYDPQRGFQISERWESVGDNLRGIAGNYEVLRTPYTFTPSTHKSVLVSSSGTSGENPEWPETETDTWEIICNELEKDLFELPAARALDSATVVPTMRAGLKADKKPSEITPALTGNALTIYQLYQKGTTHYPVSQYVLRHTTNVSPVYSANVADSNVNRIYTTAQLITEISSAVSWVYPCPGRLRYKINNIPAPSVVSGYLWGWLKKGSNETASANNRVNIVTEYWLEQWSTFLYGLAA